MRYTSKNWCLSIIVLLLFSFFLSLGYWQLSRAKQKKLLLTSFTERSLQTPSTVFDLEKKSDLRFYRFKLEGTFDDQHTFLLDNKTFHGHVGYEIYTLFRPRLFKTAILVDRGFIEMGKNRRTLPHIPKLMDHTLIQGMLNLPPTYVAFGNITETKTISWPLRIEFINLKELSTLLNMSLFPYVMILDPHEKAAFAIEWQITSISPERHLGYALQWFALAFTLLILFLIRIRLSKTLDTAHSCGTTD